MSVEAARIYATVGVNGLGSFAAGMNSASGMVEGAAKKIDSFGSAATRVGSSLSRSITLPIVGIAAAATHMALNFQQQMTLLQTQAGASAKEVKQLSQGVLDLSHHATQGPEDLAKAMYHLQSLLAGSGTSVSEKLRLLKMASEGAMTGMANLEDTTSALGGAVRTGIKGTQNYAQAMGTLNAIVGAGNMRMEDLVNALGTGVLPTAKLAGLSLRDVGAALAVFTDENVPAEQAATRLRTSLMMMQAPSKKAEESMHLLGFSSQQIGDMIRSPKGFVGTIQMIKDKYDAAKKSMGDTAAFAAMSRAFGGSKTASTIMTLVNNAEMLDQKYKQVGKTADNFNKDVAAASETSANKIKTAWSSIRASLVQLGGVLMPIVAELAAGLATLASAFEGLSPHTQHIIMVAAGIMAALGPVVGLVGTFATAIGGLITVVGFLLSPVGLLVAGIVLLVAAMVAAAVAPDQLAAGLERLGMSAQTAQRVVDGLRAVLGSSIAYMKMMFGNIAAISSGAFRILGDSIALIGDLLTGRWGAAWGRAKDIVVTAVDTIKTVFSNMVSFVEGIWNSFSDGMKIAALKVALAIVEPFSHLPSKLGGWARSAKTSLQGEIEQVQLDGLNRKLSSQLSTVGGAMTRRAGGTGADIGHAIGPAATSATNLNGVSGKIGAGIATARSQNVGRASAAGAAIGGALAAGIAAAAAAGAGQVAAAAASVVTQAVGAARAAARAHSPSRETWEKVGIPFSQGIAGGIMQGGGWVQAAAVNVVKGAGKAAQGWAYAAGQSAGRSFSAGYASTAGGAGGGGAGGGGAHNVPVSMQIAYTQSELVGDIPGEIAALQSQAVYLSNAAANDKQGSQQYLDDINALYSVNQQIQQLVDQQNQAKAAMNTAVGNYNQDPSQQNQAAMDQAVASYNATQNPAISFGAGATFAPTVDTGFSGPIMGSSGEGPSLATYSGGGGGSADSGPGDVYLDGTKVGEIVRRDLLRQQTRNGSPIFGDLATA